MDSFRLDGFFVDHGLNGLVHVVVDVFTCYSGSSGGRLSRFMSCGGIPELTKLLKVSLLVLFSITMREALFDLRCEVMGVLLR